MRLPSVLILFTFTVSSGKFEEDVLQGSGNAVGEVNEEATTQAADDNLQEELSDSRGLSSLRNFHASKISSHSVVLNWDNDPEADSYKIYYSHNNVTNVEDVSHIQPPFELLGLTPSTNYSIWIENGHSDQKAKTLNVVTDVPPPSPPVITNLTCFGTRTVYVEWTRPEQYENTIDEYELFHRPVQGSNASFSIPADPNEESPKVRDWSHISLD